MVSNPAFQKYEESEVLQNETKATDKSEKTYSYGEAIDLTGNGWYNYGLLATLALALLAMALDMFSFALVVTLSSCDLQLTSFQKNVLVSMPFVGPIIMAYAWGYICDTRGRKTSLLVALTVSFVFSTTAAFTNHWALLALCRAVSTCFCSCAQSATYTLIGESCPERVKGIYMLIMTSTMHLNLSIYYALAYVVTSLDFSYDLGLITFLPWRLLVLILALPLGISAVCLLCFYESPKFLLNAGKEAESLKILEKIYWRNGGQGNYPVKRVVLLESGNVTSSSKVDQSLLRSLWQQTAPLFRPPLLLKTLMLYYLIFALYGSNSALTVWLPFVAKSFSDGILLHNNEAQGLCSMIHQPDANATSENTEFCTTTMDYPIVIVAVCAGCLSSLLNMVISRLASHKRIVMITVFGIAFLFGVGTVLIENNVISVILYFGILLNGLNMGICFSYCVDLYPTSFRGMAACLGVMVARASGIVGVNVTGPFIRSHCDVTFLGLSILMLSATVLAYFLPRDNPKKMQST